MEEASDSSSAELLILHSPEAQEWAAYIRAILKSLGAFRARRSIRSYTVSLGGGGGYDLGFLHGSRCVVLLLTAGMLELLRDEALHRALRRLLQPPRRVVALLCGVAEELVPTGCFQHWASWSKLHAEDDPEVYITTVLEAMEDGAQDEVEGDGEAPPSDPGPAPHPEEPEADEYVSAEEGEPDATADQSAVTPPPQDEAPAWSATCLTVQPNRIRCGERTTVYIVLRCKVDTQSETEVEFSSEHGPSQRVPATVENEYTISVPTPDMPAGLVSLSLLEDQSSVSLTPVTYYTCMEEVGRLLENATSPTEFLCQAFHITLNKTESVDNMLTDLFKSKMPLGGLQLFGIQQMETNNMSTYQRSEELPTLLHFAARYGLSKLTAALLHCPGALQAYSVMNKNGDYPNTLAERSGFTELRRFMDHFVEIADMPADGQDEEEDSTDVYEFMAPSSGDIVRCSGHTGEIYESMLDINPECADDLYEVMTGTAANQNPEEAMLRTFFQAKPGAAQRQEEQEHQGTPETRDMQEVNQSDVKPHEEEEKEEECREQEEEEENGEEHGEYNYQDVPLYSFHEEIYDIVNDIATYPSRVVNRPPAPIPRPECSDTLDNKPYITRVFSDKIIPPARPTRRPTPPEPEPPAPPSAASVATYGGGKTPGQVQLIALQERVKLGLITVNEAVQEFKEWQADHERSNSLRCQQENLNRLRNSITRRQKERMKKGKNVDLEITAPIQSPIVECPGIPAEYSVYDCNPSVMSMPPPVSGTLQRGNWKTGSTSSTSSTESNRLSTHSILSSSSGTEPDFEDTMDILPPRPRSARPPRVPSRSPPPRLDLPPPVPERNPEPMSNERYIPCPVRPVPRRPQGQGPCLPPPLPRRQR